MNIETLLTELHYPPEVEQAVRRKMEDPQLKAIAGTAYDGVDFEFPLCKDQPLTRLAVVTYLLVKKWEAYREKGASEKIILDTFRDVSLRAQLYYKRTGKAGISREDVIWFRHIMNAEIFKIGSLQFQPFEMLYLDEETLGEPYMVFTEKPLPAGMTVLNVHIQRGADLRAEAVEDSLAGAVDFFGKQALLCYSWLLYPPMVERLPESSRIRQFAERFRIIGTCDDSEQARENLDRASSLQKMERDGLLGFACGVIPINR